MYPVIYASTTGKRNSSHCRGRQEGVIRNLKKDTSKARP